jgi:hypothetical protein
MTVDPVDDCTFWFSSEYYATTSDAGWRTRIASFQVDGAAPVIACPANVTIECSAPGGTPAGDPQLAAFLAGASATDDCSATTPITNNAPALFPLGDTVVTFTATDASGNSGHCMATVSVHDTMAPIIVAPADVTAECTSPLGATPPLGTPSVADICDPSPIVTNDAPASFPLGTTTVTWTATDHSGNAGTDTQNVTVVDTTPPTLVFSVTPSMLWPPNHKLVTITSNPAASDICDPSPIVILLGITSSEPDDSNGDGHTTSDIQGAAFGTDDRVFQLRAERRGGGSGRIYTITESATDHSGNSTTAQATVKVPHDQGH